MLLDFDGRSPDGSSREPRAQRGPRFPKIAWALFAALVAYGAWGLRRPWSEIRVISEPVGAHVVIDGWFVLEAPAVQRLRLGSHTVVVRAVGYEKEELTVALGPEPVLVQAKLRRRIPPWNEEIDQ